MADDLDLASLDFRALMSDRRKGLVLKPILHNYLFDARFPDFSIHFRKMTMERQPDGWFHPSAHPLWPERALHHYLADPGSIIAEQKDYMGTLSVTVGTAMHGFIQMCLADAKVLPPELQRCGVCAPGEGCRAPGATEEPGVVDEEAGERGHMDGVLDLSSLSVPGPEWEHPVFEFKTSNQAKLRKVDDLDLDRFTELWPDYYAQQQSYLRMSGRRMSIVVFMSMGYPWEMREFHVPFDREFAHGVREKYTRVRQHVADQVPPRDCCGPTTKQGASCPARRLCSAAAR